MSQFEGQLRVARVRSEAEPDQQVRQVVRPADGPGVEEADAAGTKSVPDILDESLPRRPRRRPFDGGHAAQLPFARPGTDHDGGGSEPFAWFDRGVDQNEDFGRLETLVLGGPAQELVGP